MQKHVPTYFCRAATAVIIHQKIKIRRYTDET